jgi:hypothetical protein
LNRSNIGGVGSGIEPLPSVVDGWDDGVVDLVVGSLVSSGAIAGLEAELVEESLRR